MKNLYIPPSECTPSIDLNAETGVCFIGGECTQILQGEVTNVIFLQNLYEGETFAIQNINEFFELITGWLSTYFENVGNTIELHCNLVYIDTTSSRRFLELFDLLGHYQLNKNGQISIFWHYIESDLDCLETGEEYAEDVQVPFTLVPHQA